MKILLLCLITSFQADTFPSIDSLQNALVEFHQLETNAELEAFRASERYGWIKYIPSVSFGYVLAADENGNLNNAIRPSIGFNLMNIYRYFNERQTNKAKEKSIVLLHQNQLKTNLLQLENAIIKLQLKEAELQRLSSNLTTEKEIFNIETQIFKIKETEYNREEQTEILPSQFLSIKKSYLLAKKNYHQKIYEVEELNREVERMKSDILVLAKYQNITTFITTNSRN